MTEEETYKASLKILHEMTNTIDVFILASKGRNHYQAHVLSILSSLVANTLTKVMLTNLIAPTQADLMIGDGRDLKQWLFIFNKALDDAILAREKNVNTLRDEVEK